MVGSNRSQEKIEKYLCWLNENGAFENSKINIFDALPEGDHGVKALSNIPKDAPLLLIPKEMCLFVPPANEYPGGNMPFPTLADPTAFAIIQELKPTLNCLPATALLLLAEKALGERSKFAPYLNILPTIDELHCLDLWTEEEHGQLKGTGIEKCDSDFWPKAYAQLLAPLVDRYPKVWPRKHCNKTTFAWAICILKSRAFHFFDKPFVARPATSGLTCVSDNMAQGSDKYFLIPAVDMLNHSSFPERVSTELELVQKPLSKTVTERQDEPSNTLSFAYGHFVMSADKDIPAETQIFHSYGNLSDVELLETFGFVEKPTYRKYENKDKKVVEEVLENPNNRIFIDLSSICASAGCLTKNFDFEEFKTRYIYLEDEGFVEAANSVPISVMKRNYSEAMTDIITFLHVLMWPREAFELYKKHRLEESSCVDDDTQFLADFFEKYPLQISMKNVMEAVSLGMGRSVRELYEMKKKEDGKHNSRLTRNAIKRVGSKRYQYAAWLRNSQLDGLAFLLLPLLENPFGSNSATTDKKVGGRNAEAKKMRKNRKRNKT